MIDIELKSFRIDGDFETEIQDFINAHATDYEIKGTFGPVKKPSDGFEYVFILFSRNIP